jgi:hypothetical protein
MQWKEMESLETQWKTLLLNNQTIDMGAKDGDKNHILILSQKLFLSIVHKTLTVEKGCGSVCSLVVTRHHSL